MATFVKNIGEFFGVTNSDDSVKKWRNKAEKQIKVRIFVVISIYKKHGKKSFKNVLCF